MKIKPKGYIVLAILSLASAGAIYFWWGGSSTPEGAIRKHVFLQGNVLQAKNLTIRATDFGDTNYGQQFIVEGYHGSGTGVEIRFFYLKKNNKGWYVTSTGTGP